MKLRTLSYTRYSTDFEDWDSQRKAGRFNPALELTYQLPGREAAIVTLGAGTTDSIDVFYDAEGFLYVTARNFGMSYAGLQVFDGAELVTEYFVQESDYGDWLCNLAPIIAAKRMAEQAEH